MINSFQGITVGNIHYRVLSNEDIEEAIKLTTLAFTQKEVILTAVGCSYDEYYEFMQIAIDVEKNLLVGVLWGFDKYKPSKSNPKLGPILLQQVNWIQQVGKNYEQILKGKEQIGNVLSVQKAAVHSDYLGQGIMKNLIKYQQEQALLLGYQYLAVLASSPYIQHILKQQDFPEIYQFDLKEEDLKQRFPGRDINYEFTKSQFRDGKPVIRVFLNRKLKRY
ncbi:hypothetical protein pb186bvf_001356 [Paramecium bursaria]